MDIDTDFQNQYRHVIVEYVQAKYGYDHVSQIVTYNMLGLKSIIRNVGKVLGIPYLVTDELSKNVPKKIRKFVYLEEEEEQVFCSGLPPDYFQIPVVEALADDFTFDKTVRVNIGSLCRIAHKIRAPEV